MGDYSELAQIMNPYSLAARQLISNPVQGDASTNPWQLALANLTQGIAGGALGGIGQRQQAEETARARKAQMEAEIEKLKLQKQIESDAAVKQAQAMLPIEQQKDTNKFEIEKQKIGLEHQNARALKDIENVNKIKEIWAQQSAEASTAGAKEDAKLSMQQKYGALPNQGTRKDTAQEQALKGQTLMRVADNLEQAVTKLERSGKALGGLTGITAATKEKYFPGSSPRSTGYQEAKATLSQSFPVLFSQYRVPGTGAMSDYETGLYSEMMPKEGDTPAMMRKKIALIRGDATGMINPATQTSQTSPPASVARPVVLHQSAPMQAQEQMPDMNNMSLSELGAMIQQLRAQKGQ